MVQTQNKTPGELEPGNFCSHCGHRFGWSEPPMAKHVQPQESAPFYYCPKCRCQQELLATPHIGAGKFWSWILMVVLSLMALIVGASAERLFSDHVAVARYVWPAMMAVWGVYAVCMLWLNRSESRKFRALPADGKTHWRYDEL